MVKETYSENQSFRVSMENLRLGEDGHHVSGSQSRSFEEGNYQLLHLLKIGNVSTVPEKLRQVNVVISAKQESQGYQGINRSRRRDSLKFRRREDNTVCLLWRTSMLSWGPNSSESPVKLMI